MMLASFGFGQNAYANFFATEIIDSTGDGSNELRTPFSIAVDSSGNVFVVVINTNNVFKITPGGIITEIIDSTGDGSNAFFSPGGIAVDSSGNVFVAGGTTNNAFKISTPGTCSTGGTPCTITEIIDSTGDGSNALDGPQSIAVDSSGNVFVAGGTTGNVFKISTPGTCSTGGTPCTITEIIDSTGDGSNALDKPQSIAVDSSGNVFVAGIISGNAFKISTPGTCSTGGTTCTITEIIDSTGDGSNALPNPAGIAVDSSGNVFVTGAFSNNVFKISTPGTCSTGGTTCTITEIIDSTGDGSNAFDEPIGIAADSSGNVFVAGFTSNNAFKISTPGTCSTGGTTCTITEIIDSTGDGSNAFDGPDAIAVDSSGNVFVAVASSDNAFKISEDSVPPNTSIDSNPTDPTNDNTPEFTFSGTDAESGIASFKCDLDGGGFAACTSPNTLGTLADGSHTFQVRAIDNAGNIDPSPASYTWVTEATPPDTSIDSIIDGNGIDLSDMTTVSTGVEFSFSGTDAGSGVASFECNINAAGFAACTSSQIYAGLSLGNNTFEVRAIDVVGNIDQNPASFSWTIQTPGEVTDELIQDIKDLGLAKNVENSLLGPLKKVSKILDDGNPDNDQAACDKLTKFINNVNDKESSGKLDTVIADSLEADAQAIKDAIGCPLV